MSDYVPVSLQDLDVHIADATKEQLRHSPDVQQIANNIDLKKQVELLALGQEPAAKLAQCSDQILKMMSMSQINESGNVIKNLELLMAKFDKGEVLEQKGFFSTLFKRKPKKIDDLFSKYNGLGREIEKVHYQFVLMEEALANDNRVLARLYKEDLNYYLEIEKYIVAAELKLEEVTKVFMPSYEQQVQAGNQIARIELNNLQTIADMLSQKIDELQKSRMVAILAAPQIQMIKSGNKKLMEQINGAFITTIPVFKMGIMNAVNEKRQQLHSDSVKAFENRAKQFGGVNSELLQQGITMASVPEKSATLEHIWDSILVGIADYKKIRDEQLMLRKEEQTWKNPKC